MGAIMATQFDPAHPVPAQFVNGFQLGLRVASGIAFAGVLVAAFGIHAGTAHRRSHEPATADIG